MGASYIVGPPLAGGLRLACSRLACGWPAGGLSGAGWCSYEVNRLKEN